MTSISDYFQSTNYLKYKIYLISYTLLHTSLTEVKNKILNILNLSYLDFWIIYITNLNEILLSVFKIRIIPIVIHTLHNTQMRL